MTATPARRGAPTGPAPANVDALVRQLFGALAEGLPLSGAATCVSRALRCHVTGLHHEQPGGPGRMELGGALGLPEMAELSEAYERRFQGQNLWIQRGAPTLLSNGLVSTDAIVPEDELRASPYYQHVLRRMDVGHAVGISVMDNGGGDLAVLSFNRSHRRGPMNAQEMALVTALRPHLVSAYALYDRLATMERRQRRLRDCVDALGHGVLALDHEGRVLECNAAAEALLSGPGSPLSRRADGRLMLAHATAQERLVQALRALSRTTPAAPALVPVARGMGGALPDLALLLCRVPSGTVFGSEHVVAMVVDLGRGGDDTACLQALQSMFGLTVREAAVALALRRSDPEGVALQLDLQLSTVRSHLKSIFGKLGIARQTELVRLVDRIAMLVPD